MKKNKRSFLSYLAVLFTILQLVIQITPISYFYEVNNDQNVFNIDNSNVSYESFSLANRNNPIINEKIYTKISLDNQVESYNIRICNKDINTFYSKSNVSERAKSLTEHLPECFQYKVINDIALKSYLETRLSLLGNEPYFSSIINVAKDFNINPILLFAITGQEQGFVPQNQDSAAQIANNPYNVFCSWQDYNTNIIDSSQIACRTIICLSKDKPDNIDTLVWINRKYSADQNWNIGVRTLYDDINTFINNYNK